MITNQETIKILNSWKDAVLDSKTKEAVEKAIKAVEIYEKCDWIFSGIYDPEWNKKFEAMTLPQVAEQGGTRRQRPRGLPAG